jgi:hypothetical protein
MKENHNLRSQCSTKRPAKVTIVQRVMWHGMETYQICSRAERCDIVVGKGQGPPDWNVGPLFLNYPLHLQPKPIFDHLRDSHLQGQELNPAPVHRTSLCKSSLHTSLSKESENFRSLGMGREV